MEKTDILQENLCIQRLITVVQGRLANHHKPICVKERHSDAFVYILSGSCTYRFDDKIKFKANAGDVFYLPYKSVYTMHIHTDDYKFIFCDFEFAETEARRGVLCTDQQLKKINNLFVKLLNRYHSPARNAYTECMSILYSIYSTLQQDTQYLGASKKGNVTKAKQYIDEGFMRSDLSIAQTAEKIGISEVYLRKLFKAQYGISPSDYLMSVRLKNAEKLMKYPFLSLEECALQSGFSTLQYFCRLFKKEIGISPGKFRKNI